MGKLTDIQLNNFRKLVEQIPKSDLHLHLDGSVRMGTIIDIAHQEKIYLPSYTEDGLNELVFKDNYNNLEEYLKTFQYSCAVMQRSEHIERIAYEVAIDNQKEGVRYIEVRFAPHLHIHNQLDMKTILKSVNKGLKRAKDEFNRKPEVRKRIEPPFYYGIIVCALRSFGRYSDYYSKFFDAHPFSTPKDIFSSCSYELVQGVVKYRDELGIPIIGFDLAGAEKGHPAAYHWKAYQYAHENFLHKTVHAGEAYGPESIFQAITELHADRIGHGYYLFDITKIEDPRISTKNKKEKYVLDLSQYIADRRITIEVCLKSNMQTNPSIKKLKYHAFQKMLMHNLCTTFCTDNRTVSKTTVTDEIVLAVNNFNINLHQLKNSIIYGFKRSFFPGTYISKRRYVRDIINYFEKIVKQSPLTRTIFNPQGGRI